MDYIFVFLAIKYINHFSLYNLQNTKAFYYCEKSKPEKAFIRKKKFFLINFAITQLEIFKGYSTIKFNNPFKLNSKYDEAFLDNQNFCVFNTFYTHFKMKRNI